MLQTNQILSVSRRIAAVQQPQERISLVNFIEAYLINSRRSDEYKTMYRGLIYNLEGFCQSRDIEELYTDEMTEMFGEEFIYYLKTKGLMLTTIKGLIERVKAMLKKASNYGYPIHHSFDDVNVKDEDSNAVYLSMIEITRIYYYQGLTRLQGITRDYFILGCMTGLRYSDYSRIKANNIVDGRIIQIKTQKTGVVVQIPMHQFVKEIFEKYNYELPPSRSIQRFNTALKIICRKVGLTEECLWERTVGLKVVKKMMPKWQMITSHTARRSAATNMFLAGIPTYRIMLLTGHTSEKSFFKYVRVTRDENAAVLSGHVFFQ